MSEPEADDRKTPAVLLAPITYRTDINDEHGVNFYVEGVGFGSLYEDKVEGEITYPEIHRPLSPILSTTVEFSDLNVPPISNKNLVEFYTDEEAKSIIMAAIASLVQ